MTDVDVAVVGLGIHGSAVAASLARRGRRVVAFDRFDLGHGRGSSHGRTRMIRRAYPHPVWNPFVDAAFAAWEALERETGETLLHRTGGLYAHRGEAQLQGPDCVVIDEPARRGDLVPGFAVPGGYRAVYDPAAGVIEAERAVRALQEVARRHGAVLRAGVRARSWEETADGMLVHTDDGDVTAGTLVLAGGGWMGSLVPGLAPLLEVWRILTLTVRPGQPVGMPPSLGALSVDRPEGLVFVIPDADGNGVKIGVDAGEVWDPEVPVAPPSAAEIAELQALLRAYVPGLDVEPVEAAACLYTMTEDKRFVVGPFADAPHVVVVSACSGHGFKFGPAIGDAVADLCDGIPRDDLAFISTERRGL